MNKTIPFTNDIIFKTKIASITSISLEHNVETSEHEISGNFIISGDYKVHEVSVNKEKFEYNLPFSVDLPDNVIKDTINFDISDFTYDVIEDDTLRVNIEFNVVADLKEVEETPILEEKEDNNEDRTVDTEVEKIDEKEDIPKVEELEEIKSEVKEDIIDMENDKNNEEVIEDKNRDIEENIKEDIISSINNEEDEYTTYYVHIVRENETIESICEKLDTTKDIIEKFNDLTAVSINDKLIIPKGIDE